jgi:hypothetical protein
VAARHTRWFAGGALTIAAALTFSVGGSTYSALDDFVDVPGNRVGAGVLLIDLREAGTADASVAFDRLSPGMTAQRRVWITNDPRSTPHGTISLTVHHLVDVAAPCDTSLSKAEGEIGSGVSGCAILDTGASGIPAQGNLSRVLEFDVGYVATAGDLATCSDEQATSGGTVVDEGRGNLYGLANANDGAGTTVLLTDGAAPLNLAPGDGICVMVSARWPAFSGEPSPQHPVDDAAQGDSLSVDLRFDLAQVLP